MGSGYRFAAGLGKTFFQDLLDFVYPPFCGICGSRLKDGQKNICGRCWRTLTVIEPPFCRRCGLPLVRTGPLCRACRSRPRLFSFARSWGLFEERLQQIVHLLKYRQRKSLADPLSRLLASIVERDRRFDTMEAILAVPLHAVKARSRGFNQSELIALGLARRTGRPLLKDNLCRTRNTPSQSVLGLDQRAVNVRSAFGIKNPQAISGKRFILVDDVLTTGATVDACVEALSAAGVGEVCVLTVARTPAPKILP